MVVVLITIVCVPFEVRARDRPPARAGIRVLILGDSLMATGLGNQLGRFLARHAGVACFRRTRSATGLARPDTFSWRRAARRAVRRVDPHVIVVLIGCNDGQDLLVVQPDRRRKGLRLKRVRWKERGWGKAYRKRIKGFVEELEAPSRWIVWLSLPRVRSRSLARKLTVIRRLQRREVSVRNSNIVHLDTVRLLRPPRPRSRRFAVRYPQRILRKDGVHLTLPGMRYLVHMVYPTLLPLLVDGYLDAARRLGGSR